MPKITQPKKLNLPTKVKTKKIQTSPIDYYNCLLTKAQADWYDPAGKKQKLAACCQECKTKAPVLIKQRDQELTKLVKAYQQVGASLSKLLQPLK